MEHRKDRESKRERVDKREGEKIIRGGREREER